VVSVRGEAHGERVEREAMTGSGAESPGVPGAEPMVEVRKAKFH